MNPPTPTRPAAASAWLSRCLLAGLAMLAATAAHAQTEPKAGCASIEVQQVRPQQGSLLVAAYADAESFGKQPLVQIKMAAGDAVMRFELCGLKGDSVALTLYQDLDNDGKMGRNMVGLPTEPWGGSGSPGAFGPSWEACRVPLDGKTIVVKMSS